MNEEESDCDYYEFLGLSPDASLEEIKSSYRRLLLTYHPDKIKLIEESKDREFDILQRAWSVLSDTEKRRQYDFSRQLHRQQTCHVRSTNVPLASFKGPDANGTYHYNCRCGDIYEIFDADLQDGANTVQCNGCSLFVTIS